MSEAVVEVRQLEVRTHDRTISRIDELVLHDGECVALVGESGSGKTSALTAMLGLSAPTELSVTGMVKVCGVDVLTATPAEVRRIRGVQLALVMQSPQGSLNPTMRLGALLRHTLRLHGFPRADRERRIADALTRVQLSEGIQARYPHQVSGGQAQRFAIAIALALGSRVIAADEPTSALDVTVQAEIMSLLQRLRAERGLAILLVSHDLALVSTIADRVLVMRDGEVVEAADSRTLFTRPAHEYTRRLLASIPRIG